MAAYVPVDLHRHRSVVMHMARSGEIPGWTHQANDSEALVAAVLRPARRPWWPSKRPTGGIGQSTPCRPPAATCIWPRRRWSASSRDAE